MKDTLTEMKNTFQGINSGVHEAEDKIRALEDEEKKKHPIRTAKRIPQNENSIRSLWDNCKCTNICIMGVPERKERG